VARYDDIQDLFPAELRCFRFPDSQAACTC
jgi:hypothetical protein